MMQTKTHKPYKGGPEQRFFSKVIELPNGCLQWTADKDDDGYGYFRFGKRVVAAHRFAWELEHGPIPEGLTVDHVCRNPGCVNVGHFELVTSIENARRGGRKGHPWEPPEDIVREAIQ